MRQRGKLLLAAVFAMAIVAPACIIGGHSRRSQRPGELDFKLGPFTYMEEGKLITLAVGAEATRYRENEKYMPLHVCFANRDAPTLVVTRESFILQDENGKRYPLATVSELATYGPSLMDRRFSTTFDIFRSRLPTFDRVESNFFPERGASGGIVTDRVELPRFHYMLDLLYFPHPDDVVLGRRFELHVKPTGVEDEYFVKFLVD